VVYVAGAPNMYFTHGTTRFLAQGVQGDDLIDPDKQLPIALPQAKGLAFLVYPYRQEVLERLRTVYPQGEETEVFAPTGQKAFTAFFVQAEKR
jgi:hypothetical protein